MKKNNNNKKNYVLVDETNTIYSEAMQHAQVNLDFATIDIKEKVIGVTSSIPGEGKSTTVANLASIYVKKDFKVLIIDLDLHRPSIHRFFKIPNDLGVTDYCTGAASLENIIKTSNGVDVITSGTTTPFPGKVLGSEKMFELINLLKDKYDYIFVDTPPSSTFSDALLISKFVSCYILVAQYGKTKKNELADTVRLFRTNNINIAGAILTNVNGNVKSRYNYHDYYYYS